MENWKKGDIAICIKVGVRDHDNPITTCDPPLRFHSEYIVHDVDICRCGAVSLDIGLPLPNDDRDSGVVCDCGACSSPITNIWWCDAKRFVKKQSLESQIAESLGQEKYDTIS